MAEELIDETKDLAVETADDATDFIVEMPEETTDFADETKEPDLPDGALAFPDFEEPELTEPDGLLVLGFEGSLLSLLYAVVGAELGIFSEIKFWRELDSFVEDGLPASFDFIFSDHDFKFEADSLFETSAMGVAAMARVFMVSLF